MTKWLMAGVGLMALSGCGSPSAVGENSAGSVKTTAIGEVVANIATPTPTPTPTEETDATALDNVDAAADAAADAADNATTAH